MIRLRKKESDDARIMWLIKNELFPMASRSNPDVVFRRSEMMKRLSTGKTFVKEGATGKVEGFVHLFQINDPAWIDMLAVHPKKQRRGIGSMLMVKAEAEALKRGLRQMMLYVDSNNVHGIRFYERHGFHAVHYIDKYKCYQMVKRID